MNITYIGHSGFLIEWETCYWIFDYYTGEIPSLNVEKKIFVFASHKHHDHFNPEILHLQDKYPDVFYILSSDIKVNNRNLPDGGFNNEIASKTISVKPSMQYELFDSCNNAIYLKTMKSTDCGVAFLLSYQGKTIYHAGDLNLWIWSGESKQYNNNMKARFEAIMSELKGISIDVAFAPLDPRQEEDYYLGLEYLLITANVKYVFPMHFWNQPSTIQRFMNERSNFIHDSRIFDISQPGQKWKLE